MGVVDVVILRSHSTLVSETQSEQGFALTCGSVQASVSLGLDAYQLARSGPPGSRGRYN